MELQEIVKRSQTKEGYGLPDIINSDYGLIDLSEFGMRAIPLWRKQKSCRRAILKISNYRGVGHHVAPYIGTIELQGVLIKGIGNDKSEGDLLSIENKFFPQLEYSNTLKLRRPVTEEDKEADKVASRGTDIWYEGYNVGDLTDRFNKIWDLVSFAKIVFDARLEGAWELFVSYSWANTPTPINELSFNKFE